MESRMSVLILLACLGLISAQPRPYREPENYPPMPYSYNYNNVDEYGTQLQRQETADGSGAVRGSYSYRDPNGVYRVVDYIADANGFRANVRTNEPGVGTESPADVNLEVEPPPQGIYESYTRPRVARSPEVAPAATYPVYATAPRPSRLNRWGSAKNYFQSK